MKERLAIINMHTKCECFSSEIITVDGDIGGDAIFKLSWEFFPLLYCGLLRRFVELVVETSIRIRY